MNLFDDYLRRSQDIIGDRTQAEENYDNEVLNWLRKGAGIREAISKANQKYPEEALKIDNTNIDDVAAHYDYLKEHVEIMQKINRLKKK
jgi:hypothetical protein